MAASTVPGEGQSESPPRTLRVLLISAAIDDRETFQQLLARPEFVARYELHFSSSLAEGLTALEAAHYDVCLLDQRLSESDGVDLLAQCGRASSATSVVLLTSSTADGVEERALQAGAVDCLPRIEIAPRLLDRILRYSAEKGKFARTARERDRFFRALFEGSLDAMLILDDEGRCMEANAAALALYGVTRAGAATLRLSGFPATEQHAEAVPIGFDLLHEAAGSGEFHWRRQDGSECILEYRITTHVTPGRHLAVLQDVTDRKRLGRTLDAIVSYVPAFIIVVDRDGKIEFINRVLSQHDKQQVIGTDWLDYLPPSEHEQQRSRLERVMETGKSETYETSTPGPDGSRVWFSTQIGPIYDDGRVVNAVLLSQDITELKRTQLEFANAQRWAAMGTLASGIAHEINTPVQFVSDHLHFLRDAERDTFAFIDELLELRNLADTGASAVDLRAALAAIDRAEEELELGFLRQNVPDALERCLDGVARITTIVRSMKEFAHPAHKETALADLNRAIQTTLTIARNEYRYVADLVTELGDLPLVYCCIDDINQVVLNLVVNAAHAISDVVQGTNRRGTITVRTWRQDDSVLISISDTGTGIPEQIAARIFEPFFTTKPVGKGTGQGLALAWSIIRDKHKGQLSFESKVGQGTTFFISLPLSGAGPAAA
jgi:PAS domain S-box-containing protein